MSIEVADSLNVGRTDTVLDVRSRIETEADIYNIKYPARGGLVYCIENGKYYSIKTLAAAEVNGYTIANYKVGTYEEFSGSSGSGSYSAGEGISISGGTIAVNWAVVARASDIVEYKSGTGISIVNGVINCTVTPGGSIEYTAGTGLTLDGTEFAVDFGVVARKADIPDGTTNYNALENKPIIAAGAGVTVTIVKGGSLLVSNAGDTDTNGTYEMVDQTAKGTERVWQKEGRKLYNDGTKWIFDDDTDNASFYYSSTGTTDPWGATFTASLSSLGTAPTVALVDNGMQDKIIIDIGDTIGDINAILDAINDEEEEV